MSGFCFKINNGTISSLKLSMGLGCWWKIPIWKMGIYFGCIWAIAFHLCIFDWRQRKKLTARRIWIQIVSACVSGFHKLLIKELFINVCSYCCFYICMHHVFLVVFKCHIFRCWRTSNKILWYENQKCTEFMLKFPFESRFFF